MHHAGAVHRQRVDHSAPHHVYEYGGKPAFYHVRPHGDHHRRARPVGCMDSFHHHLEVARFKNGRQKVFVSPGACVFIRVGEHCRVHQAFAIFHRVGGYLPEIGWFELVITRHLLPAITCHDFPESSL